MQEQRAKTPTREDKDAGTALSPAPPPGSRCGHHCRDVGLVPSLPGYLRQVPVLLRYQDEF